MALRDQPYLPLYIQDFLTDEKLAQCSAKATGVFIRLMCLMHKTEQYGTILLKQKNKQGPDQIKNFGNLIIKHMPYDFHTVTESLVELIEEGVLTVEGDILIQKRMVKDNAISEKRAIAGRKGGVTTTTKNFAKAKSKANSEYAYVNEDENSEEEKGGMGEKEGAFNSGIYSTEIPRDLKLTALQIGQTVEFIRILCKEELSDAQVEEQFEAFKIQALSKKQWYSDEADFVVHFRNSLKVDFKKNGKSTKGNRKVGRELEDDEP